MASRGRGRRGNGWSNNPQPSAFDQQAFIEAISATTTTIGHVTVVAATNAQVLRPFYIHTQINNTITKGLLAKPQQQLQKLVIDQLYDVIYACQTSGTVTQ